MILFFLLNLSLRLIDFCPETTAIARAAVEEYRQDYDAGEGTSADVVMGRPLTLDEHLVAVDTRLTPMFDLIDRFRRTSRSISCVL